MTALAGGHVNVAMASPNEAYALVQGGRVRCLAITALERSPTEPNTPTMRELGYDVYIDNQKGFVVPKGAMHRPRAPEKTVILMVETAGIVPTGDS